MLDPALTAQDIMDARGHFVPFVVVPKPDNTQTALSILVVLLLMLTYIAYNVHKDVDTRINHAQV